MAAKGGLGGPLVPLGSPCWSGRRNEDEGWFDLLVYTADQHVTWNLGTANMIITRRQYHGISWESKVAPPKLCLPPRNKASLRDY